MHPISIAHKSKEREVVDTLRGMFCQGYTLAVASSFGKDSSCLVNLTLQAALEAKGAGYTVHPILVSHSDTLTDAPEMRQLADSEIERLRAYARRNDIPLLVDIAIPGIFNTFVGRVIGGRGLPTFEDSGSRDCTVELKTTPMHKQRRRIMSMLGKAGMKPLTLLGVRLEESDDRASRMRERGDSATVPQLHGGHWMLSPIMHWDQEDVWTYLSQCQRGIIPSYSDFQDLTRIYADAAGSSCYVVGDDVTEALKNKRACGARTGCWNCGAIGEEDASMQAMIEADARYAYLQPLSDLRLFIRATRFDLSRRHWIMRAVENNEIRLMPDAYSPAMMEELLRICLSIDIRERSRARQAGEPPKFQIVRTVDIIAIDFQWSRYGSHPPFHALHVYRDVVMHRNLQSIPKIAMNAFPKPKGLSSIKGVIPVYFDFDKYDGLTNVYLENFGAECGFEAKKIGSRVLTSYGLASSAEIDEEGAELFIEFEMDRCLRDYHHADTDPTYAALKYLQFGTVTLSAKGSVDNDKIMRRTQAMWRAGFCGQQDPEQLMRRAAEAKVNKDGPIPCDGGEIRLEEGQLDLI